jgi:hypothetical protein
VGADIATSVFGSMPKIRKNQETIMFFAQGIGGVY